MGGEGEISQGSSPEVARPTVASSVSETANPGTDSLDVLEEKVEELKEARDGGESPPDGSAAEVPTEQSASAGEEDLAQAQEAEAQAPTQEAPKVPGKLASDPEYIKIVGEHYHEVKEHGGEINHAKIVEITEKSLSEYYDSGAKSQLEKGLPDGIKTDPLYQQKLGEAMTGAQDRGETLDPKKLSQGALAKYQQEKDLKAEEGREPEAEQMTTDQSLEDVQQRLSVLLEKNGDRLESATVTVSAKDLALLLKALAEAKEPNQKKKESKLMLLVKLLGLLTLSAVAETGKAVTGQAR